MAEFLKDTDFNIDTMELAEAPNAGVTLPDITITDIRQGHKQQESLVIFPESGDSVVTLSETPVTGAENISGFNPNSVISSTIEMSKKGGRPHDVNTLKRRAVIRKEKRENHTPPGTKVTTEKKPNK
jgi:hypothetical protein